MKFKEFLNEDKKPNGYWTPERLQDEANKYKTRNEFRKKSSGAYTKAANINILDELFKKHKNNGYADKSKTNLIWTIDKLKEEVKKYKTRSEFYKKSSGAYDRALNLNILDELFKNHPNNGYFDKSGMNLIWTIDKLKEEVKKYKTRREFGKKSSGAYDRAKDLNILIVPPGNKLETEIKYI